MKSSSHSAAALPLHTRVNVVASDELVMYSGVVLASWDDMSGRWFHRVESDQTGAVDVQPASVVRRR